MDMKIDEGLIQLILDDPIVTSLIIFALFLLAVVFLLIQDADRGERFKALILKPLFDKLNFAPRHYIAAKVSSTVSTIIKENITRLLTAASNLNLKIKWVTSAKDSILKRDGTLILYLQESDDQTKNILSATRAAIPRIICSDIRANISDDFEKAIDLTILKKVAENIGHYAHPVFLIDFLNKELEEENRVGELFEYLVEIDNYGIFISIFLEELNFLGTKYFSEGLTLDRSTQVENFLTFLLQFPRRKNKPINSFLHVTDDIKVALVLVAIGARLLNEGVLPYIRRIHLHLNAGAESVYLYGYTELAIRFIDKLLKILKDDENIWIKKTNKIKNLKDGSNAVVVILRRNTVFADITFNEKISAQEIHVGSTVRGEVKDVSQSSCFVDVNGIGGVITSNECSWYYTNSCNEFLAVDMYHEFIVKEIDNERAILRLSLRKPCDNFWNLDNLPEVGDKVNVKVVNVKEDGYVCLFQDKIQLELPFTELSWHTNELPDDEGYLNKTFDVIVYEKDTTRGVLLCSICQLDENPWPKIKIEITGKSFKGIVVNTVNNKVEINLDNGLPAYIIESEFLESGSEFKNYQDILLPGAKLNVIVDNVFVGKRKIRAKLASKKK